MLEINWKCLTLKMFIDIESIFLAYKKNYKKNIVVNIYTYLFGWMALRLWTELSGQLENTVLGRKQCKETLSFRNVRYYCVFSEH